MKKWNKKKETKQKWKEEEKILKWKEMQEKIQNAHNARKFYIKQMKGKQINGKHKEFPKIMTYNVEGLGEKERRDRNFQRTMPNLLRKGYAIIGLQETRCEKTCIKIGEYWLYTTEAKKVKLKVGGVGILIHESLKEFIEEIEIDKHADILRCTLRLEGKEKLNFWVFYGPQKQDPGREEKWEILEEEMADYENNILLMDANATINKTEAENLREDGLVGKYIGEEVEKEDN